MNYVETLSDRNLILYGKGGLAHEVSYYCKPHKIIMMDETDIYDESNRNIIRNHEFVFCFASPQGKANAYTRNVCSSSKIKLAKCLNFGHVYGAKIGVGSLICPTSIVTTNVILGIGVLVSYQVSIGHNTVVGDFSSVLPGANIGGHCRIGERVLIGANSSIRQELTIVDDVVVGMGAVVVKDILEAGVYVGNPAKKMRDL